MQLAIRRKYEDLQHISRIFSKTDTKKYFKCAIELLAGSKGLMMKQQSP